MSIIVSFQDLPQFNKRLLSENQPLVLVGGVFDIVHIGHIRFLQKAKELGNNLVILLESDTAVRLKKGKNRPVNSQKDRAELLSHLKMVDYVVLLPDETTDKTYAEVTQALKPAIIATTIGDNQRKYKEMCAELVNAQVIDVISQIKDKSTSHIAQLLEEESL